MKLSVVLLIFNCFINFGNFDFCKSSFTNNGNNDEDSFNHEFSKRISKRTADDTEASKEAECHKLSCSDEEGITSADFNCKCRNNSSNPNKEKECIDIHMVCNGIVDCEGGVDEIDCLCSDNQFQCSPCKSPILCSVDKVVSNPFQCIPWNEVHDGMTQCANHRDETSETDECETGSKKCDGKIDCPYIKPHDEFNCSDCPPDFPNSCDCYNQKGNCNGEGFVCYNESMKCDGIVHCIDGSDELDCPCEGDKFECTCYKADPVKCKANRGKSYKECIEWSNYHDGTEDCRDGSDETQYENIVQCKNHNVTMRRLLNSNLVELSDTLCENSTCYEVPSLNCSSDSCNTTDILCVDNCTNPFNPFQCDDGSLLLANNFCDGIYDCPDLSDEILSGPGFKCSGTLGYCVLPQRNLYDNIHQCRDDSDLNCTTGKCFTCLDNRLLISLKQVCDGVFDCFDLSDECLCQINVGNTLCNSVFPKNNSTINGCNHVTNISEKIIQETKLSKKFCWSSASLGYRRTIATLCDGNPECDDFSDECNCKIPPAFCNDSCHKYFLMGDRYCNGEPDSSWKLINKSICPKGFDEANCPNRFKCKAGNKVNIDIFKKCDGVRDCDDGEDEKRCNKTTLFSSSTEMIANTGLKACFWIMSILVIGGNLYVIITSVLYLQKNKEKKSVKLRRLIVLNISVADIIMGIYLLIISIYSVVFSGVYGKKDLEWRSSLQCSIVGSLTILYSEASCFLLVLLSSFQLQQIFNPFNALSMWTKPWKIGIGLAWFISAIFAFIPIFHHKFVKEIWFANEFNRPNKTWDKVNITNFACRLAQLTNKIIINNGKDWDMTKMFLESSFPEYAPKGELGYFGETSICMPRFYAAPGETGLEYTLFLITLNFIAFLYIAISYVVLYMKASKRSKAIQSKFRAKKDKNLQNRIARIILTDLFCWIPICITSYVKAAGHDVPNEFYIFSAVLLLPINSALNPFLFLPIIEKIIEKIKSYRNDYSESNRTENHS